MGEIADMGYPRLGRIVRIVSVFVLVLCAGLAAHRLLQLMRGEPKAYPNEIVGGLALSVAIALLASTHLVRDGTVGWVLLGMSMVALGVAVF